MGKPRRPLPQFEIENKLNEIKSNLQQTTEKADELDIDKKAMRADKVIDAINKATLAQFNSLTDAKKFTQIFKAIKVLAGTLSEQ